MPVRHHPGRHELGQNLLIDPEVIRDIVRLVAPGNGPIVEWAAGDGALTRPLSRLGRPLEAVEIDPRLVTALRRRVGPHVAITEGDILRHAPPPDCHDIVCNVPFHVTTPLLRRLLALPHWQAATLVTQWEVARKRAAVGGATQLTAQWWPWFEFSLQRRIPAACFAPRPSVDAGLLYVHRRARPLVEDRRGYQQWVRRIFNARGRGLAEMLHQGGAVPVDAAVTWVVRQRLPRRPLPRDLNAQQWVEAYRLCGR